MGAEIKRVPLGWEHPKDTDGDHIPMYGESYESAMQKWRDGKIMWRFGLYLKDRHATQWTPIDSLYADSQYEDYYGEMPSRESHPSKKDWPDNRPCFQLYETVTEGCPVSPVFETVGELVEHLIDNGDDFGEKWERSFASGFIPSSVQGADKRERVIDRHWILRFIDSFAQEWQHDDGGNGANDDALFFDECAVNPIDVIRWIQGEMALNEQATRQAIIEKIKEKQ